MGMNSREKGQPTSAAPDGSRALRARRAVSFQGVGRQIFKWDACEWIF
jgi:hypothetical protein